MQPRTWATSEDGEVIYVSLTSNYIRGALDVMKNGFYPYESACTAVGLPQHLEAIEELEELTLQVAREGVSMVAVERFTNKVVGVAFNKLQVLTDPESGSYFENYAKSCKHASSRGVVKFMQDSDNTFDLFKYRQVDCLMEIMFLSTLPEYRRRGIAKTLCEVSIKAAKRLYKGENIKQTLSDKQLNLEPVPKLVAALFTSPKSQKIGRKLNWTIANRISYDYFLHEGKTFSSVLGKDIPDTTLEYFDIKV